MPTIELPALYTDTIAAIVMVSWPRLVNRDLGPDEIGVPLTFDHWEIGISELGVESELH